MKRFIEEECREQITLLPKSQRLHRQDNPVRVVDVFVDHLDFQALGFDGIQPATTGRPTYHPASLLKIYIFGYLNSVRRAAAWSVAEFRIDLANGPFSP